MKQEPTQNSKQREGDEFESARDRAAAQAPSVPARREFLRTGLLGGAVAAAVSSVVPGTSRARERSAATSPADIPSFELDEITITDLQDAMKSGKYTARSIAEKYRARIDQIDEQGPAINSIIELNPDALDIADALD